MGARYTKEQAEKLNIVENRVKLRPTKAEIVQRLELEKLQEKAKLAAIPKKSKYGSEKVIVDGFKFDSKKESKRWQELRLLEKVGKITNLERQINLVLEVNGVKVCGMRPDFRYFDFAKNRIVVEDVKGYRNTKGGAYAIFRIKKKLLFALTGTDIQEI